MNTHRLARFLALGRMVLGTLAVLETRWFAGTVAGRAAAEDDVTRIVGRMYGIREFALGVIQLQALAQGRPLEPHLRLGLLIDSSDAIFSFSDRRALPLRGRLLALGIAGGYAVSEVWALDRLWRASNRANDATPGPERQSLAT